MRPSVTGERLHSAADVEQGGKREKKEEIEGRGWGVWGQGQKKKGKTAEKGQGGKRENREREIRKA